MPMRWTAYDASSAGWSVQLVREQGKELINTLIMIFDNQIHFKSSQWTSLSLLRPKSESEKLITFIFIMEGLHNKASIMKSNLD